MHPVDQDISLYHCVILGPAGTPYEGGKFTVEAKIFQEYPLRPPRLTMITPILHVNIFDGKIYFRDFVDGDGWSPTFHLRLVSLLDLLYMIALILMNFFAI
jgi:ubiquitin-protein ligase